MRILTRTAAPAFTLAAAFGLCVVVGCQGTGPSVQVDAPGTIVNVPVELDGAELGLGDPVLMLAANGRGGGRGSIVLQAAPALLQAPDSIRHPAETAYCALLPAGLSGGSYDVRRGSAPAAFSLSEDGGRLIISDDEGRVLAYNFGTQLPEGLPEEHARSSYIHPIWNLDGTPITDDFPADHLHHRGLSWMWPRVFLDGEEYDVWALRGMEQVFDEWLFRETGPACATIGVKNHWELMEDGRNVLDEWVWVRVFPADDHGRAIDVRITLVAREPIDIAGRETGNKGYGGLSLRFAPREETVIVSNSGVESEDSDHRRLPWADESGRFGTDNEFSGAAILQHADHPDFPARWMLRHYGFLGVAWPGVERRSLQPGEPLTLRYRLWIHRGNAEEGRVADAYDAFANPAAVRTSD